MLYYLPFTKRNRRIDMKIKRYIKQRTKEVTELAGSEGDG